MAQPEGKDRTMKGFTEIRGLANIKSASRNHLSCAPRYQVSYMDLYILQKEQERLEAELSRLEKRKQPILARLEEVGKATASRLEKLQVVVGEDKGPEPEAPATGWPRIRLEY